MALVFKIKFQDTIRRWVVCEFWDQMSIVIGIQELEAKIRELFHITSTAPIIITYVDTEDDVVTLADDQDMFDACLVQRLNPLRVNVKLREEAPEVFMRPSISLLEPVKDGSAEAFLKAFFPQSTSDAIKQFLSRYPQVVDMKLPAAELMRDVQLLKNLSGKEALAACDESQAVSTPSESAGHDFWHPCASEPALGSLCKSNVGKVSSTRIFHSGVQCDGCGMIPIEGSRFKSMKMYDYDLCSACFEAIGNDTDFQRMDLPVYPVSHGFYHPSCPARWWQSRQHIGASAFRPFFARGPYGWMPEYPGRVHLSRYCPSSETGSKLDATYVKDVTIFDGTKVAPCTKFTKIWRLRNAGTIPWPQKTQLVRVGGNLLSSEEVVNLELPESGLPCGAHVDASVDLIAPEEVGQYVSHWRLMSPAGIQFGHSVWIVIQVVHQDVESPQLQESLGWEETSDGEEETQFLETEKSKDLMASPRKQPINSDSGKGKEILISAPSKDLMASPRKQPITSDSGEVRAILISVPGNYPMASPRKQPINSESGKGKEILISASSVDLMVSPRKQPITSDRYEGKEKVTSDTQIVENILILENDVADEVNGTSVEQENGENNSAKEPHVPVDLDVLIPQEKEQHDASSSAIDNEVDGFSVVGKPTETVGWYNITQQGSPECSQTVLLPEQSAENVLMEGIKTEEEMQLQLLESMGFLDLALNADLLEKNNQDLLLTLDDLVEVARWDNMLKDLQEMGFNDKIMNCRLLLENQGSMKRTVKDLVELEKKKASWQEVLAI